MITYANKQLHLFNHKLFRLPVHIIGAGGMGSAVALSLIRMGIGQEHNRIHLYDADAFEPHNLANQQVSIDQVGSYKVHALRNSMLAINPDAEIIDTRAFVDEDSILDGVVFMCIDTMNDRGIIMEKCLEHNREIKCVIETRMDAQVGISYCFNPNLQRHIDCWWEQFYTDDETENMMGCGGPVSIISAIHGTTMLALKQFEKFAQGRKAHGIPNQTYQDFENGIIFQKTWPVGDHWD